MAQQNEYQYLVVESYIRSKRTGQRGSVHIRPITGQPYPISMHVECAKSLTIDYPVGTKFRLRAKLTDREGGGEFLYSYYGWSVSVIR